ncbi:MAG: NAD-dependent epimerase/dehydratase family protein [Flavobacteriaceae bacterium]|nr:NAD-dependent epimerase/dehydratase family protein [Flavobacteriaceae bacterium]
MHNILILGGGGFIGKNILRYMDQVDFFKNYKKFITSTKKSFISEDGLTNCEICNIKLEQVDKIKNLIEVNHIKTIVHLVSGMIPSSNENDFKEEKRAVIRPTHEIFSFAAKNRVKVIFISSGGTIYKNNLLDHKEIEDLNPINFYGKSKVAIEKNLKDLHNSFNLRYITLRPSNVYGNFYSLNSNQGLIPNTINNILKKEPITIWGDGSDKRDYLYAEDLASTICQMILKEEIYGEFNVASSSVHSVLEVIRLIESKINIPANIIFQKRRDVDASCNSLDTSKIQRVIDFKPHNLDYGLDKIIKKFL